MRSVLAVLLLLAALAQPVRAQVMFPLRGLEFGTLQPGVARTVSPDDPDAASVFVIASGRFSLRIITPTAMVSQFGASLPLEFASGDAVLEWFNGKRQVLTPGATNSVHVPGGHPLSTLRIGGTARPTLVQGAGEYSATIVVQISAPGT